MTDDTLNSCDNVTVIEIIDSTGKIFSTGSYKTKVKLKDNGKTLKIFINDRSYKEEIKWIR